MLNIDKINVSRGRTHVLHDLSMEIGDGEIISLIGANGAGKTTTLRTISGLLRPDSGTIVYRPGTDQSPMDLARTPVEGIVRAGICHCPEGRGIFSQLTVEENLAVGAYLRRDKDIAKDLNHIYDMFPILGERRSQAGGSLSGGEQMMLALGRSLMARPRLLILDEPSLGLAPLVIEAIFELIRTINGQGVTILLVEQNAVMALELSSRAYVLETGRVTLSGPSRELADNPRVRNAYLGGE